jgi:DNA-binding transcriptional MerR regulator
VAEEGSREEFTIDELAHRAGTTTRTLRLYQTKGLLPSPRIVGRVGYYSDMHTNRLRMIERLQKRGFSLAGIAELFRIWQEGKSLDELLGIEAAIVARWSDEHPQFLNADEFRKKFGLLIDDEKLLERTAKLKLVAQVEDGFLVLSPQLMEFGSELVRGGAPLSLALDELELLQEDARRIAKRFAKLFRTHVLPQMVVGEPTEWLERLANHAKRFRPAVRALVSNTFARAMDDEVDGYRREAARIQVEAELAEEELPESGLETESEEGGAASVKTG